jgi:hypothetical protein
MLKVKKSLLFFFLYLLLNTLLFNRGNVQGGLVVNNALLLIALANVLLGVIVIISLKSKLKINQFSLVLLGYGFFFALHSVFFLNYIGLYYSFCWFTVIFIGIELANHNSGDNVLFFYLTLIYIFSVLVVFFRDGIFTFTPPLDRVVALLFFFGVTSTVIHRRIFFLSAAVLGRSFSGLVSGLLSYLLVRRLRVFFFILPFLIWATFLVVEFLESNIGLALFYGKNSEHFLTGSGRFQVVSTAITHFFGNSSVFNQLFGIGYMNERQILVLYDLPWTTDPHNEMIRALLQFGYIGFLSIVILWVYTLYWFRKSNYLILIFSWIIFSQFNSVYGFKPIDIHILIVYLSFNVKKKSILTRK